MKQKLLSLFSRQKKAAPISILDERKHLLTVEKDFFVRESYKSLRANVKFAMAGGVKHKVLMVTSSVPGEGKSTTSINLGISFAQEGKHVLLIDCDLRRAKLGRLLNLKSKSGLSDLLVEPDQIENVILNTSEKNLQVVLAGSIPPNPSELLGSASMHEVLETLKQRYDIIILDTPPVNLVTDAMELCPQTDGVLMVMRAGQSERGAVLHALNLLERTNAKILGLVLNGVKHQGDVYGKHHGRYGYGYGYGYTSERAGSHS